jgi:hypothetical protein
MVLPGNADVNVVTSMPTMEEATAEYRPLNIECSNQEVETNGTETIPLQECHQEPKSDEHHNMNILKYCTHKNTQ